MGCGSSKSNAVAPNPKPLKTLEELESENQALINGGDENNNSAVKKKAMAFVIPADDNMLVTTKKPGAEHERLSKEKEQLIRLQRKLAEQNRRHEENRQKELSKIIARQGEREERARMVMEKRKLQKNNPNQEDEPIMEVGMSGAISNGSIGNSRDSADKVSFAQKLNPIIKVPAHLRRAQQQEQEQQPERLKAESSPKINGEVEMVSLKAIDSAIKLEDEEDEASASKKKSAAKDLKKSSLKATVIKTV